jgi:hypothetical protein
MVTLLVTTLLLAEMQIRTVTEAPPKTAEPPAVDALSAEAEPDMVVRGRSTTVVVKGGDEAALQTLQVDPADGIKLGAIKVLPPRPDGAKAVEVTVTVDAAAKPGDRDLMLTVTPTVHMATTPPRAADPSAPAPPGDVGAFVEKMRQEIIKRETKPLVAGTLHVNTHEVKVTAVDSGGSPPAAITVTVTDEAGDVVVDPEPAKEAEEGIVSVPVPLLTELHCGKEVIDAFPEALTIAERKPPTVVLAAKLDAEEARGRSGCELRVRVQDKEGNLSNWYTKMLPRN